MSLVVVHTPDVVGERMAGPGIRALHLARQLARHAPVALIAKFENAAEEAGVTFVPYGSAAAASALKDARVLIGQPSRGFRKTHRDQRVVFDLFDPTVLELRELYGAAPSLRQRVHLGAEWGRLAFALMTADLLMVAAPKQRAFYRQLQANDAPWIEVPFGLDPADSLSCPKPQDNIIVWGGGVWEWLDPATAIDAVQQLNREGLRCRLLFMGRQRPNDVLVDPRRDDRFTQLLARGGPHVSANAGWVPYRERLSWLRSGKIAIMLHRQTAEAEYSIRTRLFDAIAAGVPVVATKGGFAAELVEQEQLGLVVPPGDTGAVAGAIRRLLTDDVLYARSVERLERVRPRFAWENVTRPLTEAVNRWLKQP